MEQKNEKLLISIGELALKFGVSLPVAYRLARSEGFPTIRVGRRRLVDARRLDAWIAEQSKRNAEDQREAR